MTLWKERGMRRADTLWEVELLLLGENFRQF